MDCKSLFALLVRWKILQLHQTLPEVAVFLLWN